MGILQVERGLLFKPKFPRFQFFPSSKNLEGLGGNIYSDSKLPHQFIPRQHHQSDPFIVRGIRNSRFHNSSASPFPLPSRGKGVVGKGREGKGWEGNGDSDY